MLVFIFVKNVSYFLLNFILLFLLESLLAEELEWWVAILKIQFSNSGLFKSIFNTLSLESFFRIEYFIHCYIIYIILH